MEQFYKATRPDGTDFRTGEVLYEVGKTVTHPRSKLVKDMTKDEPYSYLSVSTVPTDCTGMSWPCRLFVVEGVKPKTGLTSSSLPNKRCFVVVKVVEELPSWQVFGPQGKEIVEIISRRLTQEEIRDLNAARAAAWAAARAAAWAAAPDAARAITWDAAWAAALAWLTRDLITAEQFLTLYNPWLQVIGSPTP